MKDIKHLVDPEDYSELYDESEENIDDRMRDVEKDNIIEKNKEEIIEESKDDKKEINDISSNKLEIEYKEDDIKIESELPEIEIKKEETRFKELSPEQEDISHLLDKYDKKNKKRQDKQGAFMYNNIN